MTPSQPARQRLYLPGIERMEITPDLGLYDRQSIAVMMTMLEADITFDGLQISTDWLDPRQLAGTPDAQLAQRLVEQAIDRHYADSEHAAITLTASTRARDAVRFLRALQMRTKHSPSQSTRLLLVKEWQ